MIFVRLIRSAVFILLTGIGISFFASCGKNSGDTNGTPGGRMTGTVQTWDDKLNSTSDMMGITVTVSDLPTFVAITDGTGNYTFGDLPFGVHDLTFAKTGYGTSKLYGVVHNALTAIPTTIVPTFGFGKVATTTVTALALTGNTFNGQPGVSFSYNFSTMPTTGNRAFVRYFLSTAADVSSSSYTAFSPVVNFSNLSAIAGFTVNDLVSMGFSSGQTVYVRMYGESFKSNEYKDPNTGKWVFPNVNTTTVSAVSFQVP